MFSNILHTRSSPAITRKHQFALGFLITMMFAIVAGCASNGSSEFERKSEDREAQMLKELEQQRIARIERLRNMQQGVQPPKNWVVKPMIDPIAQKQTCVVTLRQNSTKRYHGHNIDLSVANDKAILHVGTLKLITQAGTGISVDDQPVHEFNYITNSGDLIIDETHTDLITDLTSGKTAELSFSIVDSIGIHKLQYSLDGFRNSYLKLDDC